MTYCATTLRVVLLLLLLNPAVSLAQDAVVRIGLVGPTSGALTHLGRDNENGARIAIDELNARGVVIGGKRVKLELLAEDDAADPKQGTAAAQKLVDSKVSGVVGHLTSGTSIPASRIYSDAGIPQISPSVTNTRYTRQGFKTTFRVVPDDSQIGSGLGKYVAQQLKAKSIAVIDDRTAYGQGIADAFERSVTAAGGQIAGRAFVSDKATDFTSVLTSIKSKQPDVVFFGGMDAVAGPLLRQMKELGIDAKLVGGDGICSSELPKLASGAMSTNQVICAEAGGVPQESTKALTDFRSAFKKKFNTEVQEYAPFAYDSVNIMVQAMIRAGSSDPAKYLPILAKTENYKGVTGNISFDARGDVKNGTLALFSYSGGDRKPIGVIASGTDGGGDSCFDPKECRCKDRTCKKDCC